MKREFVDRHVGPTSDQIATMLHELQFSHLDEFIAKVLPDSIKLSERFGASLPAPISEFETIAELKKLGAQNLLCDSLIG
ncbi:MAG: hypothetical protein EB043_05120, partial [Actinobacteria bacterium]|nr:hypothetical protein [Actinomycetota bacterium]